MVRKPRRKALRQSRHRYHRLSHPARGPAGDYRILTHSAGLAPQLENVPCSARRSNEEQVNCCQQAIALTAFATRPGPDSSRMTGKPEITRHLIRRHVLGSEPGRAMRASRISNYEDYTIRMVAGFAEVIAIAV